MINLFHYIIDLDKSDVDVYNGNDLFSPINYQFKLNASTIVLVESRAEKMYVSLNVLHFFLETLHLQIKYTNCSVHCVFEQSGLSICFSKTLLIVMFLFYKIYIFLQVLVQYKLIWHLERDIIFRRSIRRRRFDLSRIKILSLWYIRRDISA